VIGRAFPSTYFQHISVGTITKALGFSSVAGDFLALGIIIVVIVALSRAAIKTQEA